jgi:hypothetical protein
MDPDDPEARIRELEVGSYSENPGMTPPPPRVLPQPSAPAPPPPIGAASPPPYGPDFGSGTPYGPPSPMPSYGGDVQRRRQPRAPSGARRIALTVFGVLMVSQLWGFGHSLVSQWWPHSGGGSSTGDPVTVEQGGTLSVSGNDTTRTVGCNGGTLTLGGNDNTFTVTGHCLTLQVSGNGNRVTVDSADTIKSDGIRTVTVYHSGTPKIIKTGIDITVDQG